jgi:hypothetical protein
MRMSRSEWVILAGVLAVILSVSASGVAVVRRRHRHAMARADLSALLEAGNHFYDEYGIWPTEHSGEYGDYRYGRRLPNAEVVNVLRATDGPGNHGHVINPKRIVFFEVEPYRQGWSGLDRHGDFLDPWGQPYQLVLDTDLDSSCDIEYSIYGKQVGKGMVVWSCGPDRLSDTADDIVSWEK